MGGWTWARTTSRQLSRPRTSSIVLNDRENGYAGLRNANRRSSPASRAVHWLSRWQSRASRTPRATLVRNGAASTNDPTAVAAAGFTIGVLAAVTINNLPAAVLLSARPLAHPRALLIGLNVGPNLAAMSSLSALSGYARRDRPARSRHSERSRGEACRSPSSR